MSNLGFTGTRNDLTPKQAEVLHGVITVMAHNHEEFHYGDCVGADKIAFAIARAQRLTTVCHPPDIDTHRAFTKADYTRPATSYLKRNHNIVDSCNFLIACPNSLDEVVRSGTWATMRYAWKKNIAVGIIYPNGKRGFYNGGFPPA